MTELLSQARLQQMAAASELPQIRARPPLVLRWQIDATTGRPVSRWEIESQRPPAATTMYL